MIRELHDVLTVVWYSGNIPPHWKKVLAVLLWKKKGYRHDCNNSRGVTLLSVRNKVFAHLLQMRIRSLLLKYQRPEQSGFTSDK